MRDKFIINPVNGQYESTTYIAPDKKKKLVGFNKKNVGALDVENLEILCVLFKVKRKNYLTLIYYLVQQTQKKKWRCERIIKTMTSTNECSKLTFQKKLK